MSAVPRMREPSKFMCGCGRVAIHSPRVGRGRCTMGQWLKLNPRWRAFRDRLIVARFKAGVSLSSLGISYGRVVTNDAIRRGLR